MKSKKIEIKSGKVITLAELFKEKAKFHKEMSRLPFEEKIRILMLMRRVAELRSSE